MTCRQCKRPIDELMEAYIIEKGLEIRITGCADCINIAVDRIKTLENSRNN